MAHTFFVITPKILFSKYFWIQQVFLWYALPKTNPDLVCIVYELEKLAAFHQTHLLNAYPKQYVRFNNRLKIFMNQP